VFLDRKFGFRLAVASGMLAALLGGYLVTSEPAGPEPALHPRLRYRGSRRLIREDGPRQQQQRDAVLVDLASYHQ
jgi:hypothetical protein